MFIPGLDAIGNEIPLSFPVTSQFTGTLADGTPFSFAYYDDNDQIQRAKITLVRASVPRIRSRRIELPDDPIPSGVRGGQTLVISDGAALGDDFHAGHGSTVLVQGGNIGDNFEAAGATVNITGGTVGYGFGVFADSVVNISGDATVESLRVLPKATVHIDGGHVDRFFALQDSVIHINGGTMAWNAFARDSANVIISGNDFQLNGTQVAGFDDIGSSVELFMPQRYQLTGTLSDGTPFVFASSDKDRFEEALTLVQAPTPQVEGSVISVPTDPPPRGVRSGQTLAVQNDGAVGDHFNAGIGSTVIIDGGTIGENFEATGSMVHVRSGQVGDDFDAFVGTTVHVEGGEIGTRRGFTQIPVRWLKLQEVTWGRVLPPPMAPRLTSTADSSTSSLPMRAPK